jgi:hypothetical protein
MNDVLKAQEKETGDEEDSCRAGIWERNFQGAKADHRLGLGDLWSFCCVRDEAGHVILEQKLPTTPEAMKQTFSRT